MGRQPCEKHLNSRRLKEMSDFRLPLKGWERAARLLAWPHVDPRSLLRYVSHASRCVLNRGTLGALWPAPEVTSASCMGSSAGERAAVALGNLAFIPTW